MDIKKYVMILAGIVLRKKALTGPYLVQLEITNACNTVCLYCMNYSKLGLKEEFSNEWKRASLDFESMQKIIPEMKAMGVKEIDVTGSGEPFSHPKCLKVFQLVKDNKMRCIVRTNGLLITRKIIDQLLDMGFDGIDLSLWAGTAQGYIDVHPGEDEKSFLKIKDWLVYLAQMRSQRKSKLKLKIINVIGHENFRRVEEMLAFAHEIKADYVVFKYVRSEYFKGEAAEHMELSSEEKKELSSICKRSVYKKKVGNNLDFLVKSIDQSFKVNNCYFGWLYSRLMISGEVLPCCGCPDKKMGNFKKNSLSEIWYGPKYNEFREKSKNINTDKYFKECACTKLCPHFMPMISMKDMLKHIYQIWTH